MNVARIGLAVASGLSIVCATCTKYWKARDAGIPGDRCVAKKPCGSPIAGKAFPEYEGPIRDFAQWCFVCGQPSTHAARHTPSQKTFGLCREHVKFMTELRPTGAPDSIGPRHIQVVEAGSKLIDVDRLLGKKKPSLAEAIFEAETYFEEKDRVRGSR